MASAADTQLLYITYFGRPADPAGLIYWTTGPSSNLSLDQVSDFFAGSPEFARTTIGKTTEQIINSFYRNAFGRNADAAGLAAWTFDVNNGRTSIQDVGILIVKGALNQPPGNADRIAVESKLAASNRWTASVGADVQAALEYAGPLAFTYGVDFLEPVLTPDTIPSLQATQASIALLPPVGTVGTLTSNVPTVTEGGTVIFTITTIPGLAGQFLAYSLSGAGLTAQDVVTPLAGQLQVGNDGVAVLAVTLATDAVVETGESLSLNVANVVANPVGSGSVTIIDSSVPPVPLLSVSAAPSAVDEGSILTFIISTDNIAPTAVLSYTITGISSADVNGALLTGTRTVKADGTVDPVVLLVSSDLSTEGQETATFTVTGGGATAASTTAVLNDTSVAPAVPTQAVLTASQDISGLNIVAPTTLPFTYFANEETLGQSDQLSGAPGSTAETTLNVGTQGNFSLRNFSTDGIQTLFLRPSDDWFAGGEVDLQAADGLLNINVEQSALSTLFFGDIQSAEGFVTSLTDTFTDFEFNFDINALIGSDDEVSAIIAEAPIDALSGISIGLDFTQGPTLADAGIEVLNLTSTGANALNVVDILSVGSALGTLIIDGDTSLRITADLGLFPNDNSRISLLDASNLEGDLSLAYTSELGDANPDNNFFDVDVLGATGENVLLFGSTATPNPTDFRVLTQNSGDTVLTAGGADSINVAEGDNSVEAGNGQNTVAAGDGDDTVVTGFGNDRITVGAGNNSVEAGDGQNVVTSGAGNDTILTGSGIDSITAGAGDNSVISGAGNDTIVTLAGDDTIFAGQGNDSVQAGDGNNTVIGDDIGRIGGINVAGNDVIVTGTGNDLIIADAIGVLLNDVTGAGNDSVISGAGDDTVLAGSGSNTVSTGAGNDIVTLGESQGGKLLGDGFANTVTLGEGEDLLQIDTNSLTVLDSINGGIGIDTIELHNGGVLAKSETLRTKQIEAFDLVGLGGYDITLGDELVRSSDQFSATGARVFSVFTSAAGNVQLDLSFLTPVDAQGNLLSIRYFGQADTDRELVIIRDGLISDQTFLAFGEAPLDADETFADFLQIVDSVDVTKDDLLNITGLEVIELASSVNGAQTFTIELPGFAGFNSLVGDSNDILIIRATPLLNGSVSTLNLRIDDAAVALRVIVQQSANLNVVFTGAFPATLETALFYTNNVDRLPEDAVLPGVAPFIADGATVIAFQADDVQSSDFVNANENGAAERIEFRFAVSNPTATLEEQLDFTLISGIDEFLFVPAAVNQAVSFDGIGVGFAGLDEITTSGGNDRLINIERNLTITTNGGDDTVSGADGASLNVFLGLGDDIFLGSFGNDTVDAGSGDDTVSTGDGDDFVFGREGDDFIFTGENADTVNDLFGDNFINTGLGNDSVFTGSGNDFILTEGGADTVRDAGGNNTINTSSGDAAGDGDLVITGAGNDSIVTGEGNDVVNAGDGNNTVFTGLDADIVMTGSGNDFISTADNVFAENEFVSSGAGNDTVIVGLGNDTVNAGDGNDLIVLGSSIFVGNFDAIFTPDVNGLSLGDSINGGSGEDTVALSLTGLSTTTLSSVNFESIEVFNIAKEPFNPGIATLNVDTSLVPGGGTVTFNIVDFDISTGFVFDATTFVQGQSVIVNDSDLDGGADYRLGAGDDVYSNNPNDLTSLATVAGNGGSDTINLVAGSFATIRYNTGNDGGQGGTGTGGDLITGFTVGSGTIDIAAGLLTDIGGFLTLGVTDSQLILGGLTTGSPGVGTLNGQNNLSLTGPSRSLTDAELTNAARVASNINGVGVVGNGFAFGELVGLSPVDSVTNQALIVQQGQTKTALYLYTESSFNFDTAQAYTVEANELRQLGIFDNALFTGAQALV